MDKKKLRGNLMLLFTAIIWGSAFVAQKSGMDYVGPFAFNGVRTFLGALMLVPVIMILDRVNGEAERRKKLSEAERKAERKLLAIGGILCGICLFTASSLQQIGMLYTTAGKAGFITALYVVLVPIVGLFIGKRVRKLVWACVAIAAAGLYLLCMPAGGFDLSSINKGDFIIFLCAITFTFHILVIDYFSPRTDGVKLSCIQFFVVAILSIIPMIFADTALGYEMVNIDALLDCVIPLLYSGLLSGGVGYTLQVVAQKDTDPTVASMLLCLESVFAVIAGAIILHEVMRGREIFGCVLMFVAIVCAQLPEKKAA